MYKYLGEIIFTTKDRQEFYTRHEDGTTKYKSANHLELMSKDPNETEPRPATTEDLNNFAVVLNSPWSQTNETYEIEINCKDSYTEIDPDEPIWRCDYRVVGYECITGIIRGYGDTPMEALTDCQNIFDILQKTYNPDDDSF